MSLVDFQLADLKKMSMEEMQQLALEIRQEIIATVSKNGGHLASNLGVVELTIALHKVFDCPRDVLLFDVSHQTYAHKLLTDRYSQFSTLRQMDGISGFAKRSESIYDAYEAGHSSTSISAGLGFLEAKKEFPDKIGEVIAVIGDASIMNGLSFEAINYLGAVRDQKMIIIINDNEMSVSRNVGALAKAFNNIRVKDKYKLIRKVTPKFVKNAMKSYAYGTSLFEGFGFKYLEGIDGHDFKELIKYLTYAKSAKTSVILHVKTKKGKGYAFAEEDHTGIWHGTSAFDITTGIPKQDESGKISFGEIMADELIRMMKEPDGNLLRAMTPAMTLGSGLSQLQRTFPKQLIDVGIAEENAVTMAALMAQCGLKPVVFIYATFLQRAYDELLHDVGRSNQHVVFCVDRAGIIEADGDTHQGIFDIAFLKTIPNMKILSPKDACEARQMLRYALTIPGPVVIRYPKMAVSITKREETAFMPGWKILKPGKKYIVSYGPVLFELLNEIAFDNKIGLINASTIQPLDTRLLLRLWSQDIKLYIYEEVISTNSLATSIIQFASEGRISTPIFSMTVPDCYLEVGTIPQLKEKYHITIQDFMKYVRK